MIFYRKSRCNEYFYAHFGYVQAVILNKLLFDSRNEVYRCFSKCE